MEPWNHGTMEWIMTFHIFSWEWNVIIPTDEVILFGGVAQPPTSIYFIDLSKENHVGNPLAMEDI
jgi:hypothetical protein